MYIYIRNKIYTRLYSRKRERERAYNGRIGPLIFRSQELYAWDNSTLLAYQFLFKDPNDAGAEPKDAAASAKEQYNA